MEFSWLICKLRPTLLYRWAVRLKPDRSRRKEMYRHPLREILGLYSQTSYYYYRTVHENRCQPIMLLGILLAKADSQLEKSIWEWKAAWIQLLKNISTRYAAVAENLAYTICSSRVKGDQCLGKYRPRSLFITPKCRRHEYVGCPVAS